MTDDKFEPRSLSDWYRTKRNVVIKGTYGDKREQVAEETTGGLVFKTYNNIPIVIDRYPDNPRIRALAIDAVRHPNRPKLKAFTSIHHEWLKQLAPTNLSTLGGYYGETKELEKTIKEIMERHKETLDRLAEDD